MFTTIVLQEFFDFLRQLTPKDVTVKALPEGSVCFPRIPLMTITGPLIIVQVRYLGVFWVMAWGGVGVVVWPRV